MRDDVYRRLVWLINAHRSWIRVDDRNEYGIFTQERRDTEYRLLSRTLMLKVIHSKPPYSSGHTWRVPEFALDRALAEMRRKDTDLRARLKVSADRLTAKDAEALVRNATNGIVRLQLYKDALSADF